MQSLYLCSNNSHQPVSSLSQRGYFDSALIAFNHTFKTKTKKCSLRLLTRFQQELDGTGEEMRQDLLQDAEGVLQVLQDAHKHKVFLHIHFGTV